MKKITKELLIVSMVLTLFIGGFSTSVSASVSINKQQKEIPQQVTNNEISLILSDDLIKQVNQYIEVKNKRFKISNQQKLKEEIGTKQFQIVKSQVKIANKQLSDFHKNDLTVEGNVVSNKFSIDVKDNTIFYRASAIEGKDDIKVYWWGCKIWLSKTTVRKILNVGSAGGSAALGAKIGAVPGAVAGAVVGSVLSEFVTPSAARAIWIRHNWVIVSGFGFQ